MKKLVCLILLLGSFFSFSQNKSKYYQISKLGSRYSSELITEAFNNANMCGNFYETLPNDIIFDDGTIVRLVSKKELTGNTAFSDDCFLEDTSKKQSIIWGILPNGTITKGYNSTQNTKSQTINN